MTRWENNPFLSLSYFTVIEPQMFVKPPFQRFSMKILSRRPARTPTASGRRRAKWDTSQMGYLKSVFQGLGRTSLDETKVPL